MLLKFANCIEKRMFNFLLGHGSQNQFSVFLESLGMICMQKMPEEHGKILA